MSAALRRALLPNGRSVVMLMVLAFAWLPGQLAAESAHETDAHAAGAQAGAAHADAEHGAEHHGPSPVAQVVNFTIFFGALFLLLRKPIASFFKTRRASIEQSLTAAERAQAEADAKIAEMNARLAALDGEVAALLQRAGEQARAEHEAIIAAAQVEAERILAQAEEQVKDVENGAIRRLKATAADLAVQLARQKVEQGLQADDRKRLFERTLKGIQKAAS